MEKKQFIAKVNAFMPLAFLSCTLCFLGALVYKPELRNNDAIIAVMGGMAGSAATVANTTRDLD